MITIEEFLDLPTEEVAEHVRASGSKVLVFPINGTRRWFLLEHGGQDWDNPVSAYKDLAGKKHIDIYKLIFDHGIDTLLTPTIGPEILATRDAYMQQVGAEGLARLATHEQFISFYEQYEVRVRFYGEYRKHLAGTAFEYLCDLFDQVAEKTKGHQRFRLFFGAFADQLQAAESVAQFAVRYFQEYSQIPERRAIIEMYYGEYIEKADIFIGFDRFAVFDYPLLNSGQEDLYFTVAPSLYMNAQQLSTILYDHLYSRKTREVDYLAASHHDYHELRNFYTDNSLTALGTGHLIHGVWAPHIWAEVGK